MHVEKYSLHSKLYVTLAKFVRSKLYVILQYQGIVNVFFLPIMSLTI